MTEHAAKEAMAPMRQYCYAGLLLLAIVAWNGPTATLRHKQCVTVVGRPSAQAQSQETCRQSPDWQSHSQSVSDWDWHAWCHKECRNFQSLATVWAIRCINGTWHDLQKSWPCVTTVTKNANYTHPSDHQIIMNDRTRQSYATSLRRHVIVTWSNIRQGLFSFAC